VSKPYKSGRPVPSIDLDGTTDALVPFTDIQMTSLGILPPEPFLSDVQAIDKWITINNRFASPTVTDLPHITNDRVPLSSKGFVTEAPLEAGG
jgi:hypothetical protein